MESGSNNEEDESRQASVIASIVERQADLGFPEVLPAEVSGCCNELPTEELIQWFRKSEFASIKSYMDEEWRKFRSAAEFVVEESKCEAVRRAEWAREHYYRHLAEYKQQQSAESCLVKEAFCAILPMTRLKSAEREEVERQLMQIKNERVEAFVDHIGASWRSVWESLPVEVRVLESVMQENWLLRNHAEVLNTFLSASAAGACDSYVFKPEIKPEDLGTDASRAEAASLVKRVRAQDEAAIVEKVESGVAATMAAVPAYLIDGMQERLRRNYLEKHYFEIIRDVVKEPVIAATSPPESSMASPARATPVRESSTSVVTVNPGMSMLVSPKRRRTVGSAIPVMSGELAYKTSGEIHSSDVDFSDAFVCEAYVVYFPDTTREASIRDKRTGAPDTVPVMTCVLVDREGPFQLDLWRSAAVDTLAQLQMWSAEGEGPPLVEVRHFNIRMESSRRRALCKIRKIQNSERTQIRRLDVASRSSVANMDLVPPLESLYFKDFINIETSAPFIVNVSGIVLKFQEPSLSQNGNTVRSFQLCDKSGRTVLVTALGRHVDNDNLQEKSEVIIYFAAALPGASSSMPGQLWIYDDAHIVALRHGCSVPFARSQIMFRT